MLAEQIKQRGVSDARVLAVMRQVPREAFVPVELLPSAYDDTPLPIEAGQTISQPFIVALMLEAAQIQPGDRVLDVGAGSGYASALASLLAKQVYAIERHGRLTELAQARLTRLGYANVELRTGDGSLGWPAAAPFDAILVAAGAPRVPAALRAQLAPGGRLVMPVGARGDERLVKVTRLGQKNYRQQDLGRVAFVPLLGAQGWDPERD